MGFKQNFILYEHSAGFAIFSVKHYDDVSNMYSAHPNSFLKLTAFLPFKNLNEALKNVDDIKHGRVSDVLKDFLLQSVPSKDAILSVIDPDLGESIKKENFGFECTWTGAVKEITRIIRENFYKLAGSLIEQPGSVENLIHNISSYSKADGRKRGQYYERRCQLVVSMADSCAKLKTVEILADTGIIRVLNIIDEMTSHLYSAYSSLKKAYSTHFPELSDVIKSEENFSMEYLQILSCFTIRKNLLDSEATQISEKINLPIELCNKVKEAAGDSVGQDVNEQDVEHLKQCSDRLLKLHESRERCYQSLNTRLEAVAPNMFSFLNITLSDLCGCDKVQVSPAIIAARLIAHAGNINKLALKSSSQVLSLGASKNLFRRAGTLVAKNKGLLSSALSNVSSIENKSKSSIKTDKLRRKISHLVSSKTSVAVKADCYKHHNPAHGKVSSEVNPFISNGAFGKCLAKDVSAKLDVWVQSKGVNLKITEDEMLERKKKLKLRRKKKRSNWIKRKLSKAAAPVVTEKTLFGAAPNLINFDQDLPSSCSSDEFEQMDVAVHQPKATSCET